jgi:hypothetical protein
MITGNDRFGQFTLVITPRACECCGRKTRAQIGYALDDLELPNGIDVRNTILRTPSAWVGLDCGCYGKFHRQVAHIMDRR